MSMKCELFFFILCGRGDLHTTDVIIEMHVKCEAFLFLVNGATLGLRSLF